MHARLKFNASFVLFFTQKCSLVFFFFSFDFFSFGNKRFSPFPSVFECCCFFAIGLSVFSLGKFTRNTVDVLPGNCVVFLRVFVLFALCVFFFVLCHCRCDFLIKYFGVFFFASVCFGLFTFSGLLLLSTCCFLFNQHCLGLDSIMANHAEPNAILVIATAQPAGLCFFFSFLASSCFYLSISVVCLRLCCLDRSISAEFQCMWAALCFYSAFLIHLFLSLFICWIHTFQLDFNVCVLRCVFILLYLFFTRLLFVFS